MKVLFRRKSIETHINKWKIARERREVEGADLSIGSDVARD